ncbi:MAG: pyridoxamine 5'-phosphate oxidase family protein [Firmicutes bacterium]|nr:pyridoxamine 5'-phosphate oxidase family protein [Bacillota bacterium]
MEQVLQPKDLKKRARSYLLRHHVVTLATLGEGGPQAAAVFYASRGWSLYFLSDPGSRHSRNITAGSPVAATIHEDYHDWREIKGLQLEGWAEAVNGGIEKARAMALFLRKFPYVAGFRSSGGTLSRAMEKAALYRFSPSIAWYTDNSLGFGTRFSFVLQPPSQQPPSQQPPSQQPPSQPGATESG